jgi:hypothetical protein
MWTHFFFLPTDPQAQLYDIQGTWLRVTLGIFMASGLGLMVAKNPKQIIWILLGMATLAIITLGRFLFEVWHTHQWIINDYRFPFKYKSAVVYFLMFPCMAAYGVLQYCSQGSHIDSKRYARVSLGLIAGTLAAVCWVDFIAAHALNGVLVAGIMGCVLMCIGLMHGLRESSGGVCGQWFLRVIALFVLTAALAVFWQYDEKYEGKLAHLLGDAQIAMQIDQYSQWKRDPQDLGPRNPIAENDRPVNESTYERTAWFVKGARLLGEHPLGAGFSQLAFRYFMHQENPKLMLFKTHSGWLDYALGLGLPGLFLTWLAMGGIAVVALSRLNQKQASPPIAIATLWILGGCWLLWWPTEVSEREFIEYLFFILALLATINLPLIVKGSVNEL